MTEVMETTEEKSKRLRKEYMKQYYQDNSDKMKEQMKAWRETNSEKLKEQKRNNNLKKNFGIDLDIYNQIHGSQEGCCKICRTPQSKLKRALAIDHCHQTNEIRGLLCSNYNTAIGLLKDSESLLKAAIKYLKNKKRNKI
jgi:hypothetical protein